MEQTVKPFFLRQVIHYLSLSCTIVQFTAFLPEQEKEMNLTVIVRK